MNIKIVRNIINIAMPIMMITLMAYQLIGKAYHEYAGTALFIIFIIHNILNIKIRDIVYVDYEETIQMTVKSKGIRLDIYVEDDNNTVFNLEMQTTEYEELPK